MGKTIALFDVDGTLTLPRGEITPEMESFMLNLSKSGITVGIVGGSDLPKQMEQLGETVLDKYEYNFSQNGLVGYRNAKELGVTSINAHLGEKNINRFVNWCMGYLSKIDLPIKRGTFVEFRTGMFNVSPIGRNCSREERNDYEKYDLEHKIRENMIEAMKVEFKDLDLCYSIGGQISFDVFPKGWNKTYCLQYISEDEFDTIHFFGDKIFPGGNDYELGMSERTIEHKVECPEDTMRICKQLFFK